MKHEIKPLNVQLINQIAAGEVIEGPYSAVKELVENAIDAGASEIIVEIQQGGKSMIAVKDNGMGIPGDQIKTAFLPHTTSKLRTIEDLQHIHTLGFRGEALASIAAVARVEVLTRAESSLVGYRAFFENGSMASLEETGCPKGTRVVIRDLFYQTPARLKFMKSVGAETSRITEMLTRLVLSRTDITFQYINNNNIMLTTRSGMDPMETARSLFPPELAHGLTPVDEINREKLPYTLNIRGLLGQAHVNRGNRNYQVFFVNGRSIRSELLTGAFERAYEGALMVRRFPVGIVYITISPGLLDVNVHPSKTSIKFQDQAWMEETLTEFVRQGLQKNSRIVTAGGLGIGPTPVVMALLEKRKKEASAKSDSFSHFLRENDSQEKKVVGDQVEPGQLKVEIFKEDNREDYAKNPVEHNSSEALMEKEQLGLSSIHQQFDVHGNNQKKDSVNEASNVYHVSPEHIPQQVFLDQVLKPRNYKLVGQAFNTYIILETGSSLYLVDQHAAHERVVYEQLLADAHRDKVEIQEVMDGQILELSLSEMEWFQVHEAILRRMGFIIEPFGYQAIRLTGVPYHIGLPAHQAFLQQLMDELMDQEWSEAALPMEKLIRKACRYAIKAHDELRATEMAALLEQMTRLTVPLTCPHGRPIVLQMRDYDLEKLFKRV